MEVIREGSTDQSRTIYVADPASTTGQGKTGLVAADLKVSYIRRTNLAIAVTDVTSSLHDLSALGDGHMDWGWKEISPTLAPGAYRLDLADALFTAGTRESIVHLRLATGDASVTPMKFDVRVHTAESNGSSITSVLEAIIALENAAVNDAGGASTTTLIAGSNVLGYGDDFFKDMKLQFQTGPNTKQARIVVGYTSATGAFTFDEPFAAIPAHTNAFRLLTGHNHPISQIAAAVANLLDPDSRLRQSVQCITKFTVGSGSTTTNIVTSAMDPAASVINQYRGLVLAFAEDTPTAALRGQKTDITASTAAGELTVTALTTAPANGDYGTIS